MDFANNVQLSLTLAALSVGLWWTFDRSRSGFGLGVIIAILATLVTQLLVYNGVFQWVSHPLCYKSAQYSQLEVSQNEVVVVLRPVQTKSDNHKTDTDTEDTAYTCIITRLICLGVLFGTSLSMCKCMQIYLSWLPVHSVLAAMYLLRWGHNCGKYWTTVSSGKLLHSYSNISHNWALGGIPENRLRDTPGYV